MSSNQEQTKMCHKEEQPSRIKSDQNDRSSLRSMLDTCIHPLECATHTDGALINIVTGPGKLFTQIQMWLMLSS